MGLNVINYALCKHGIEGEIADVELTDTNLHLIKKDGTQIGAGADIQLEDEIVIDDANGTVLITDD